MNGAHNFVWLLNDDTEPAPDCLEALLDAARQGAGPSRMVQPTCLHDPTGRAHAHFGSWIDPVTLRCGSIDDAADLTARSFASADRCLNAGCYRGSPCGRHLQPRLFPCIGRMRISICASVTPNYPLLTVPGARVEHSAGTSSASIPVQRYLWHFASQGRWLAKHHTHPHSAQLWLQAKSIYSRRWPTVTGHGS